MLTGGGSGGHITPILAVASELKKLRPDIRLVYIGQKGDALSDIPAQHPAIDAVYAVRAGKFRRYHGEGLRQFFAIPTQAKNVRDAVWVCVGIVQSFWLLRRLKPAIIFSRGGFVSVPVAVGGHLNGIPYMTHDSDSTPSLANRVIARWATLHAVAMPEELYPYPRPKTVMVGVPVGERYEPVTKKIQQKYKQETGLGQFKQVLLVTGGGNGADQLNRAAIANAAALLAAHPRLAIVHVAGRALELSVAAAYDAALDTAMRRRIFVKGFVTDLYRYSGAADVILARAGATNLAEFAIQAKACIIVPAAQLVGGHQVKNAQVLADRHAIVLLSGAESGETGRLAREIGTLLDHADKREALAHELAKLARPDAARRLAMLLLEQA